MNGIITLKKNEERRIRAGHLWVFSNEIGTIEGEPQAGDVITLKSSKGDLIGTGFYHPHSLIAVRLLSRKEEEIGCEFFRKKILSALELRQKLYPQETTYRVVHGEADFLPGLIIDRYNDCISIQTFSAGMDMRLPLICDILETMLHPAGIIERNESVMRTYEGLPLRSGILRGTIEPITISICGMQYTVNLLEGQKTAFFLDQRENRRSFEKYVSNCRVLDCFCNDGGFTLHAARAGASEVMGVDSSSFAVERARENAKLNNLCTNTQFVVADAFDFLEKMKVEGQFFDVINLDPPSFAKNKKMVTKAKQGYKKLHRAAMQILSPGGILATASCAHHIYDDVFLEIVSNTALELGKSISLLEWHGASPDHPVLPGMPETGYLKFGVFKL